MGQSTILLPRFDIETTLLGGQAFRWEKIGENQITSFQGIVSGRILQVRWEDGGYVVDCDFTDTNAESAQFIRGYFDLDRDYGSARNALIADPMLRHFASSLFEDWDGPRILRQPWFETTISFIVSANNHIPRIRNILRVISRTFGKKISNEASGDYAFPTPEQLAGADLSTLRGECNTGYRDIFIRDTARRMADAFSYWNEATLLSTDELRTALLELPGIGPKVAECILLFGFHRFEAFPVDTWVRKAVSEAYFGGRTIPDGEIRHFAADHFGPNAGLAQQYLFEAARKRG